MKEGVEIWRWYLLVAIAIGGFGWDLSKKGRRRWG
jgi:hypothetical protein